MTKLFENAMKSIRELGPGHKSKVPKEYLMGMEDTTELMRTAMEKDPFDAVYRAFLFGFVMGNRATIRRNLKKL